MAGMLKKSWLSSMTKLIETSPTRGRNTLDLLLTNFNEFVTQAGVTEAVRNADGQVSDHRMVYLSSKIPRVPQYVVEKYSYLQQTAGGGTKN